MSQKNFKLTITKDYIATLEFSLVNSKVNILTSAIIMELSNILDDITNDKSIKLLIIQSAKIGNFIAGADINEIAQISTKKDALEKAGKGQEVLNKIAQLPFTTIAYIDGSVMGGGLELALCCDFRVATNNPKVKIALPEVNLGIIPGFGGTQRLPRLIGLVNSLPMILSAKSVNYKKAFKIGLIDDYFSQGYAKEALKQFTDNLLSSKFQHKLIARRNKRSWLEKFSFMHNLIFFQARKMIIKKTLGNYPAPLAALEVVKRTYKTPLAEGLKCELEYFANLATTQVSKNLTNLYFINEEVKKSTKLVATSHIKRAAILGSGVMGGGIAWLYSKLGLSVRMKDINWTALALGYAQIRKNYLALLKVKKTNKLSLISATKDFSGFKSINIISEAVIEDIKLKKQVLAECERYVADDCIIASNSSALSISQISESLKKPERFLGLHFFNPVNRMPLVEIIPHDKTSKQVIDTTISLMRKANKIPIIVKDKAGFLVNRILLNFINEAFYILDECGDIERIDNLLKKFGMPMGPLTLADNVGLDVGYKVSLTLENAYGSRMKSNQLINDIYNKYHLLGKKSGEGIYVYKSGKSSINNRVKSLCKSDISLSDIDIIDRTILIMVNEAARCLDEKIVSSVAHLDLAMITGTGFPAYHGGLLKYADNRGLDNIVKRLNELAKTYGNRFVPCEYLLKLQKAKHDFYK
jgi:3-hydroxyacyl-CoA dehydrogenase/enoyl-CoA hydratase/3-hydroxybutyryl-CoA epimerase